jgi:hypothetical protein
MFAGSEEIASNIYLYKNFLNKEENSEMLKLILSESEQSWDSVGSGENTIFMLKTEIVEALRVKIASLCPQGLDPVFNLNVNKLNPGVIYGEHVDINNSGHILKAAEKYIEGEDFTIGNYPRFGLVYYFNDNYDQGEIYYPEIGLTHKPSSGDLVIHAAHILHGTNPPVNGIRYSYTSSYTEKFKMSKNEL